MKAEVLNRILGTEDGRELITFLWRESGYSLLSRVVDPHTGDILHGAADFNEGRRSLYVTLRHLADPLLLGPVETDAEIALRTRHTKKEEEKK